MKSAKVMLFILMALGVISVHASVKEFSLYVERYTDLGGGQVMYEFGTLSEKGQLILSREIDEKLVFL